jgi:hypothetical protein
MSTCECHCPPNAKYSEMKHRNSSISPNVKWTDATYELSQRNFIFEEDRLAAISGITAETSQATMSSYSKLNYVGLRRHAGLLSQSRTLPRLSPGHRSILRSFGPIWRAICAMLTMPQVAIVIGGKCDLSTIDPFGRVREGYVKLFGPVKSGHINHDWISLLRPSDEERFPSEKFPFCADGPFEVVGVEEGIDKEETGQAEEIRR